METKVDIQQIKSASTSSVIFLSIRNFGIQGISILGFFILSILLGASEVGLFSVVAETVAILGYFSDIGLSSALIQKKEPVSDSDLRTSFTIQQILVVMALVVVSLIYPGISSSRNFGPKETWILIALCFSFVAASLKTIPSVLLERDLDFKLISTVDIIENALFYIIAVLFAFLGYGAYSYAIAAFIRSIIGLIIMYKFKPWNIGIDIDMTSARSLFKYGIPFQLNSFIAVAKDRFSGLIVAGIIGTYGFGLISWAQKSTRIPLSLMDSIMKVTFPAFSRLQHDTNLLKKSIEKSTFFIALFVFPMLVGICLVAPDFIEIIPKYSKWIPALIPMYLICISAAIASVTTPLTNAFNAVGRITTTTKLMIMWTVLTWLFYPLLSYSYGYLGTSIAALLVGMSSFIVWYLSDKYFLTNIFMVILKPLIGSLIMLFLLLSLNLINLSPLVSLISKITLGLSFYAAFQYYFSRNEVYWFLKQLPWPRK